MNLLRTVMIVLSAAALLLFAYLLQAPAAAGSDHVPFDVSANAFKTSFVPIGASQSYAVSGAVPENASQATAVPGAVPENASQATVVPGAASDYASFHFGFKKSRGGSLPSIAQEGFMDVLKRHNAIFLGDTSKKELYLTFDNGYENGYTAKILDILREKQVPAAFFVTGHFVKDQPELVKRMAAEGHIVGNHSWSHPDLSKAGPEQIRHEMEQVRNEVARLTGQTEMRFMRPPRGIFSGRMLAACKELGYTGVFWSIAYKDWETGRQQGAQYAYDRVMEQLHPGAVILLHSVSRDNAEALGRIIDSARGQGYTFKSLDALTVRTYR
jgi:peptidoglycan-N-acetylmuramic acid deacetylase